ncbi:MAG: diguanylate cyclase [Rhizobiales bacterium]|nr:diguanylate cyclase [Hyphomicrobiales bacterium]MBN9010070.1 diguanylate cyclase [Hyphomicrobiales bacterium]
MASNGSVARKARLPSHPLDHPPASDRADRARDIELEALRERVRLLEAVVENFPGGISLFDKDLRLTLCNAEQRRMLDYPDALFAGGPPSLEDIFRFKARSGEYGPGNVEDHVRVRMDLAREHRAHAYERTRPNGTVLEIRGVPLDGGGFLTTYLDVTEQRRVHQMVAHAAHHDPLTGLPNRLLFADRLGQAVARVGRGEMMALLYIDLDRYKPVNDVFGHPVGDELLKEVAHRLRRVKRESDTVARLGGDEFAIVQTGIRAASDASALARRLVHSVAAPYSIDGHAIVIGATVGIAIAPFHGKDPEELLRNADFALYRCKADSRGSFRMFDVREEAALPAAS